MEKDDASTPVFALATTSASTRHAVAVARALAERCHAGLSILTARPAPVTISSARAHAYDVPADQWDPDPIVSPDFVRTLAAAEAPDARIVIGRSLEPRDVRALLPPGATVVVSGPARHFLESPEQRLARGLAKDSFDVVFLPTAECREGQRDRPRSR
jgi:hypothetical protein